MSGGGKGVQPYSDCYMINLDPRAEGKADTGILIETSSISTLGRR